jgi:hypothetical protein
MVFNVQIVNHTQPGLAVVVADKGNGTGGVTYAELKNSLGQQTYDVGCLYLYSTNERQLSSVINYNIYDINGNVDVTNIVTTIDPYQFVNSLLVSLKEKTNTPIILNGNSSVSTTILPNSDLQIKFLADRITNKLGLVNSNFTQMQEITNTNFFETSYSEAAGADSCSGRDNLITMNTIGKTKDIQNPSAIKTLDIGPSAPSTSSISSVSKTFNYDILLLIAIVSSGIYLYKNKD